jgi:hypothetical protein
VCIEVHQALGLKYQRLAVSSVRLKDIITNSGGKVHGKAVLSGVESIGECVSVGTLDYWIKLKLPITQAIRLYQVSATICMCDKHMHIWFQSFCITGLLYNYCFRNDTI